MPKYSEKARIQRVLDTTTQLKVCSVKDIVINGIKKTKKKVKVTVSPRELERVVEYGDLDIYSLKRGLKNAFLTQIGIKNYDRVYINKKGNWEHEWEAHGGSHGWDDQEEIRPATENEKIFMKSLDAVMDSFVAAALEGDSVRD